MKKKVISLFMVLTLVLSSFGYVLAFENHNTVSSKKENIVYVSQNSNGRYMRIDTIKKSGTLSSMPIKAILTENENVYKTESGDLIKAYNNGQFVVVEKVEVLLSNMEEIKELSTSLNLPKEVVEDLLIDSQNAIDDNNDFTSVTLILPKQNKNISLRGYTDPEYYTYDDYFIKEICYEINNGRTPHEKVEGYKVKDFLGDASTIAIIGAGFSSTPGVALVAGGVSILDFIIDKFNTNTANVSVDNESYSEVQIAKYDSVKKYTYVSVNPSDNDDYSIGAITRYVYMEDICTESFVMVDGEGQDPVFTHTKQKVKSDHYDEPEEVAISSYVFGYWDEGSFDCKIETDTATFTFKF